MHEPLLEPMADAVYAFGEIEKLVRRLRPVREAFERLNRYGSRISRLELAIDNFLDKGDAQAIAELREIRGEKPQWVVPFDHRGP